MTIWVTTNGRPSNGAKALASQEGFKWCVTGKFIKVNDLVVNWGSSQPINAPPAYTLNLPSNVAIATNKLAAFEHMHGGVKTVDWTGVKAQAQKWHDEGFVVVARTKLTGHSGDGIIIVGKQDTVPDAPLYTKYVFKDKEFRVHVVRDKVIDTQRKIKDPEREVKDWKVRSHANGFIFVRGDIDPDPGRDSLAIMATKALGLDFGAVDIIQDKAGVYYVLEINTAPGLEGQTVERYATAFRNI